jgi:hypothetical protein
MFSALRQGSLLYILYKADKPALKVGQVTSVSQPQPKYNTAFSAQPFGGVETTVDISAKAGDEVFEFKQLPSHMSIANYDGAVVSESREAMCAEVEAMQRTSRQHIESAPYHESVVEACDYILRELNPHFAKEKAQEEKIEVLETKMTGIEGTLDNIMTMLSDALNKKAKKED